MKTLVSGLIVTLLLVGCAKTLYVKPGGTPASFERDKEDCMYEMGYGGVKQKYLTFGDLIVHLRKDIDYCLRKKRLDLPN